MCIRDRCRSVCHRQFQYPSLWIFSSNGLELMPVSYTHLDVYKRQLLHGAPPNPYSHPLPPLASIAFWVGNPLHHTEFNFVALSQLILTTRPKQPILLDLLNHIISLPSSIVPLSRFFSVIHFLYYFAVSYTHLDVYKRQA